LDGVRVVPGEIPTAPLRLAAEVYPHPAMVRLFRLDQIIKYKKGLVRKKRGEFARLQGLLCQFVASEFPFLTLDDATRALLSVPWSKAEEDRLDAFFCAMVGLWHVHHCGRRSEVLGDMATGFILLPHDLRQDV
jgi:predicted RNase H-like nuclease